MKLDEKEKEATDLRYQIEKDDFQLKIKEENLSQCREQLRKSETLFKEEVDRIRKEYFE